MSRSAQAALLAALLCTGCKSQPGTVLVVVVTLSGSLPPVSSLDVTLSGSAGTSENRYPSHDGPIAFPTTLTASLPSRITGDISVDIRAEDAGGEIVARGQFGPFALEVGGRQTVYVRLGCGGAGADGDGACNVDGGADGPPARADGGRSAPSCGNGRVDFGESCDTAIPAGAPGACPRADCDDRIPCTTDTRKGDACTAICNHEEITGKGIADGCCPAGARAADDADCPATCGNGVVDTGEACDTGIGRGQNGACPAAADCDDGDPCTGDALISASTCFAVCAHVPITTQSGIDPDGCCPAGAGSDVDVDCPVACGNGIVELSETCDVALPPEAGGCPRSCDDGDPCTIDFVAGAACRSSCAHTSITVRVSGDGCCPAGASRGTDGDCPAACGNGVLEPGESCDSAATGAAACPTSCPAPPSPCVVSRLLGSAGACSARCATDLVTTCSAASDGCCPAGCTAASDADCSSGCGSGSGPTSCPDDGNACTRELLVSAGTCEAACLSLPITEFRAGDGCCPPGGNFLLDADCAPVCGNGVAETPTESCDYAAASGACPAACPAAGACVVVQPGGSVAGCTARCTTRILSACAPGDGCCPAGCTSASDGDCGPVCGDGVVQAGERCDRAITAGKPGACAPSCDDHDACTADFASGTVEGCSRLCTHARVTACRSGDGCCPPGCAGADSDCNPSCGDRRIGAGETCDPPSSCPTTCPDDGDPCTRERLTGDTEHCSAACEHLPITACSGATPDLCCPTGCTRPEDVDCN